MAPTPEEIWKSKVQIFDLHFIGFKFWLISILRSVFDYISYQCDLFSAYWVIDYAYRAQQFDLNCEEVFL